MTYLRRSRNPFAAPKPPKKSRIGKTGTVRLVDEDMKKLREQAYLRDNGRCQLRLVCSGGYIPWKDCHLAHKRTKRNHGDSLSNVQIACPACHIQSHAYGVSKSKPVPRKEA
jgi:5-methylcytosine-specific restriction endonuclease McrA